MDRRMRGRRLRWMTRVIGVGAAAGCQAASSPAPLRSPLNIEVLETRASGLTVHAARPLAWALIEVGPLGQLRLLYADSVGPLTSAAVHTSLPVNEQTARKGRLMAPGPVPRWSTPCAAEGNEVVVDPQTGLHLYSGTECLRVGAGRIEPAPNPARSGYWLVFGSVRAPTGAALRRMLQTLRPVPSPGELASGVADALIGRTVPYDYTVLPIPITQAHP
jgi:hypothetical protein